eukprot:CAMPEP_0183739722 /NCGR_PEP_ID=MMETSP0737-20130205/57788_1 /TAXON_ID=385413 /ORGANISM="Thalassiosira miniscula, Strain CCMP1093" /LENGTH=1535 /DNA_ID=CAMNT_0025974587 /DNA_START=114 /DNA_END=4721 /DNA_ORIENTATION=+
MPTQPRQQQVTTVGEIGRAFLRPASPQQQQQGLIPQPPPPINNYFQPPGSNNPSNMSGGINVDNIFASMAETSEVPSNNNNINANSNNIFNNFAAINNENPSAPIATAGVSVSGPIPFRKYSDSTNNYSRGSKPIPANNTANLNSAVTAFPTAANVGYNNTTMDRGGSNFITRSESDGLSKSLVTPASFMRRGGHNRVQSVCDPPTTKRHAGYLLKRSNLPFTTTSSAPENAISQIAPMPDLSQVNDDNNNGMLNLPFGGLDDMGDYGAPAAFGNSGTPSDMKEMTMKGMLENIPPPPTPVVNSIFQPEDNMFHPILEPASANVNSATIVDTADSPVDKPCFCSPVVQYFEKLFHTQKRIDALVTDNKNDVHQTSRSEKIERPSPKKIPLSPSPTRPLPITPTQLSPATNKYTMPLKEPARSVPVPISPGGNDIVTTATTSSLLTRQGSNGSSGHLSRSFSNGGIHATNTLASAPISKASPKKDYPPPPEDYIDPKDGHIWRAKYCVLEEGILYFYRTAEEGESEEAQNERYESRMYSEEQEDIVLGEVYVTSSSSSPSNRTMSRQRSIASSEKRSSSRDMYELSKSPMPTKRMDLFHFTKSPFHRSGSSILTVDRSGGAIDESTKSTTPMMRHSSSASTFLQDSDIMWEKRVSLDCVGAVRSSEQEHGDHAFELLAYGSDDPLEQSDASTRASRDSSVGGQQLNQEIVDRLILRACSLDDMNLWMFQFHMSLTSFMMEIVNSVKSGGRDTQHSRLRPGSPAPNHHRRLPAPIHHGANSAMNSFLSPFVTSKNSFASSPTAVGGGNNSFGGGSFVGSLSHGHGRNALYRRQVRDNKSSESGNDGSAISPLLTPVGTPGGGSSPVDKSTVASPGDKGSLRKKKQPSSTQGIMIQSDYLMLKNKVELSTLKDLRGEETEKETAPSSAAPKKYIPPHMRTGSAGSKKYVPPHMRKKLAAASVSGSDADEKQVPLNDEVKEEKEDKPSDGGGQSEVLDGSLSDSALSAASTSSLLSRQLEDTEAILSTSMNVRLGGCADPTVVVGSILDHTFIGRKSSVVGNVRLEAYGALGGGFFTSSDRKQYSRSEEESMDNSVVGMMASDSNNNLERRSVLKWEVGASSECGVRNSNEDSYVAINNLDEVIMSQGLVSFSQQDVLGQTSQQGLYAIFDGHVGNQAARFSAEKFPDILIEEQSLLASRDSASLSTIEERADFIMRKAFDRLDQDFCSLCTRDGRDWDCGSTALVALIVDDVVTLANLGDCRGVVYRFVSGKNGSTDTETDDSWEELDPAVQEDNLVWDRANGGGGDAYTSGGRMLWKEITETHSPLSDEERARIENANGWILHETEIPIGQVHRMDIFDEDVVEIVKRCFADRMKQHRSDPARQIQIARTCGDLAVSRAIGDRDFKAAYNMPSANTTTGRNNDLASSWEGPPVFLYPDGHSGRFKGDLVSSDPDIKFFKIGQEGVIDEFLLMACDGLWDVMDGDDAVRIAKNLLFDKKLSAKDGAARLAELAQHLGSSDNITVVLIRFYWEEEESKD